MFAILLLLVIECSGNPLANDPELFRSPEKPAPFPEKLLSNVFGHNMVLQRAPQQAMIWGFTKPNGTVTTLFNEQKYTAIADSTGVWRLQLPPTEAGGPYNLSISTIGESVLITNVLFGEVYFCGGQSNMQQSAWGMTNASYEIERANSYHSIRLFTVGQGTDGGHGTRQLGTIAEGWSIPNNWTMASSSMWGWYSAVCWIYGRTVYDGLQGKVPIGLISNNWGGTSITSWMPSTAFEACNHTGIRDGDHFTGQIVAYTIGPMTLGGFTWYQGEANAKDQATADAYACFFPAMITSWRKLFNATDRYFGFVQLSTWCGTGIAELREAQMAAVALPNVGFATNADYGDICNLHPPSKQYCGTRLGNSALAIQFGLPIVWASPQYKSASVTVDGEHALVTVTLDGVTPSGLKTIYPANYLGRRFAPAGLDQVAWSAVQTADGHWYNATSSPASQNTVLLNATVPSGATVIATSYGWGSIPLMNLYDMGSDLPVLPWKRNVTQP